MLDPILGSWNKLSETNTIHHFKESSSLLIPENLSFKQVLDNAKNIITNIQISACHPPCFRKQRSRMK